MINNKDSQYPHLYNQAENIENQRQEKDLLYNVFMNIDTTKLQETILFFVKKLKESDRFKDNPMSKRLIRMMDIVVKDDNRLLKHSFILFALQLEPWAVKYFM